MVFPKLKTERILLRQIGDNDLKNIHKGLSHPEVTLYYGVFYKTLEETKEQMEWYARLEEEKTGLWWALCDVKTQKFFGAIGFNNHSTAHRKAEIGFWLLPEYQKKGILSEALDCVLPYGFEKMDLHRIEAEVETENTNCIKLLLRKGFAFEGTKQDSEIKNEKFISLSVYSILNTN